MEPGREGSRWYYVRNGERHGPIGESELKDLLRGGEVGATDYVWHEAMPDWQEAKRVPSLVPSLIPGPALNSAAPAETVPFNAPLTVQPSDALQPRQFEVQSPPHARQQPYFEPQQPQFQQQAQYAAPQQYGAGPPGHYPPQQVHLVPQAFAPQPAHFVQPYPAPAPHYAPTYQQLAVVAPARATTTGLKVAGFIFNIFFLPGLGTFFVGRPGQAVAQILLVIFGVAISLTGVGAVVGVPMAIGAWIWALVTVATVPTAPPVAIVHHTYHAPR